MLSRAEIARYLNGEVNVSRGELVQFFHSTFYKEGLGEEQYLLAYNLFVIDLDKFLFEHKDLVGLDGTFLKDRPFTTLNKV